MQNDDEGATFRPNLRPLITAVIANVIFGVALLGGPYVRGQRRADASTRAFTEFAACILGGRAAGTHALAFASGDREHFASRFAEADASWPLVCAPHLDHVVEEPVFLLLPSPKQAESDLRAAVEVMHAELDRLHRRRTEGDPPVPERPLAALAALRGAVGDLLHANGQMVDPTQEGVVFDDPPSLARPARIPLRTGAGFFELEAAGEGLRAVAGDAFGLAETRVAGTTVQITQLRRPNGARGVHVAPEATWGVWLTSDHACRADAHHCARRLTGLGRLVAEARVLAPEVWLSAHPAERLDRALAIDGRIAAVLARTEEEGLEARWFELPELPPVPAAATTEHDDDGVEPIRPATSIAITGTSPVVARDALYFLGGAPPPLLPGGAPAESESSDAQPVAEATLRPTGLVRLQRQEGALVASTTALPFADGVVRVCGEFVWAAGANEDVVVHFASGRETGTVRTTGSRRAAPPPLTADGAEEHLAMACDGARFAFAYPATSGELEVVVCDGSACTRRALTARARDVALGFTAQGAVLAWSAFEQPGPIRAAHLEGTGLRPEHGALIGSCWDSGDGLCGRPFVVATDDRFVVAAREGSDLLAVEEREGRFEAIRELAARDTPAP